MQLIFQNFRQVQLLVFQKFMVKINLLVVISFHILSGAIGCHKIHVEQSGTAVQVELSSRDAVDSRICRIGIGITGGCDAQNEVVQSYFPVEHVEQGSNASVQTGIDVLHFHGAFAGAAVIVVARIVGERQKVGDIISAYSTFLQQPFCQQVDLIVYEGACCQSVELVSRSLSKCT